MFGAWASLLDARSYAAHSQEALADGPAAHGDEACRTATDCAPRLSLRPAV